MAVRHLPQQHHHSIITVSNMSTNRIYISNLNFSTTEDELLDYFKEYQVVSVLIPSQTVRFFRNNQVRPLGIAYAEFPSTEKALDAIEALNGRPLKDRELRLKPYVPYSPEKVSRNVSRSRAFARLRRSRKGSVDVLPSTSDSVEEDAAEHGQGVEPEIVAEASIESSGHEQDVAVAASPKAAVSEVTNGAAAIAAEAAEAAEAAVATEIRGAAVAGDDDTAVEQPGSKAICSREPVYSDDTLYLGFLPKDVDDVQIRDHLEGYHPNEIWIFRTRPKGKHLQLHRHFMAALVTIKTKESLDDVVEKLSKKKFHGKRITVRKARLSKLKEVQSMADGSPSEQPDVDFLPLAEAEAEAPAQQQEAGIELRIDTDPDANAVVNAAANLGVAGPSSVQAQQQPEEHAAAV